jgi:hypothetical protein
MSYFKKILFVLFILLIIYLWNRFVITTIIKKLIGFHKKYNPINLHRQPIKFVVDNEKNIVKYLQYFYWFGAIIMCVQVLFFK